MHRLTGGIDRFLREHLALGKGYYRELAPAPDLRHLVACRWVSVVEQSRDGAPTPIIPDGCSDIMTHDADSPQVVGPDTKVHWVELRDGAVITGLRLRPGALKPVFGCSAATLLDEQARLGDLGTVSSRFLDGLGYADTLDRRHALLEDWVRSSMRAPTMDERSLLRACRTLSSHPELEIGTLAKQLGWHARKIHRQFVGACGYGPKHLQRVMRIQSALRAASAGRLSEIATTSGFSDQAHMTREFRDLTSFTPVEYFARHSPEVGRWLQADFAT